VLVGIRLSSCLVSVCNVTGLYMLSAMVSLFPVVIICVIWSEWVIVCEAHVFRIAMGEFLCSVVIGV